MSEGRRHPGAEVAWVHVPEWVAGELDRLADACQSLAESWFETAQGMAVAPRLGSPAAIEAVWFRATHEGAPRNVEHGPGQQGALYVDAVGQRLSIEALLRARRVSLSLWPLVRAELELAGRVAWLLDPRIPLPRADVRIARLYLERISALQRDRNSAGKFDKTAAGRSKVTRDQALAEARELFDPVLVDMSATEARAQWRIGDEQLLGLGAAAELFVEVGGVEASALYDVLSDYSHPSLASLARQTSQVEVDGTAWRPWSVDVHTVGRQIHYGCAILYGAAHIVAGYYELDTSQPERWGASLPDAWFASGEGRVGE